MNLAEQFRDTADRVNRKRREIEEEENLRAFIQTPHYKVLKEAAENGVYQVCLRGVSRREASLIEKCGFNIKCYGSLWEGLIFDWLEVSFKGK